ncbi:MAG: hypothetical protein HY000_04470 [Planctomycetes bacterium]|nr:hypothetical protein [Planctomycetota bacterium]
MDLFRLHAYSIIPQKSAEELSEPDGGAVAINDELRRVITDNVTSARFDSRTVVDFQVDPTTRTNQVRDMIVQYAFGQPAEARAAALALAKRLSAAMDFRSTPCLFILAALREDDRRTVTLWTFPRGGAFRLRHGRSRPLIQVLTDVFSQTSRLRKAAQFQGRNLRNHFLSGRALDFQANHASRDVADFWIGRLLGCRFGLAGEAGTRLLARTVRKAYEECDEPVDREELYTAVMAIRLSPHSRLSLQEFANRYLQRDGSAYEAFTRAVPNRESLTAVFDFERRVFDAALQFRVFQLNTGVFVSSPLAEIGESVKVTEGREKRLSCAGAIVDDRLRTRHA